MILMVQAMKARTVKGDQNLREEILGHGEVIQCPLTLIQVSFHKFLNGLNFENIFHSMNLIFIADVGQAWIQNVNNTLDALNKYRM